MSRVGVGVGVSVTLQEPRHCWLSEEEATPAASSSSVSAEQSELAAQGAWDRRGRGLAWQRHPGKGAAKSEDEEHLWGILGDRAGGLTGSQFIPLVSEARGVGWGRRDPRPSEVREDGQRPP